MNNPFPTAAALAAEAMVDRLLAEQEAASGSFRSAATAFLQFVKDQHYPLGSPVHGYDLDEIVSILSDFAHNARCPETLQEWAEDIALARFQP